ncbi:MAG: UvrD-helicase domain-containing protein [Puniceicoccaceae bacterium]
MTASPRPHLLVRASAGSGKTYKLVRRLIGLLADGEAPDSILAATFSRKAAGEFRAKLLRALAEAADGPAAADTLAHEIERPGWSSGDFLALLGSLVRNPDTLRLSTIDAFFLELVGLFRLEFGLGTEIHLSAETADDFETRDLLRRIFADSGEEIRQALFHLVDEDREDESVRGFQAVFESWIARSLNLYRTAPDAAVWGRLPEGMTLPAVDGGTWSEAVSALRSALAAQEIPEPSRPVVDEVLAALEGWDFSPTPPAAAANWIKAGAEDAARLLEGKKYFSPPGARRVTLAPETGGALVEVSRLFHARTVALAIRNTRAARSFLALFEREYEKRRLAAGAIRFADLPFLLNRLGTMDGAVLAYRIDARLRHWLLDEFQDTSRNQWAVIGPLVEELFYDAEENRSFFCVGDPKQAIYGWREGDSRLFDEIAARYESFEPRPLETETLSTTYRCSPAVVDFVNGLFGSDESFPADTDPVVVARWMAQWGEHRADRSHPRGRVEARVHADGEARDRALLEFLDERRPWEKGRTTAVLCRKNSEANRFESLLRSAGIPTIRDGALAIAHDFTSGRLLHAIFRSMLHPGDSLALGFLRTNSAAGAVAALCGGEITPAALRRRWETGGSAGFLAAFESHLEEGGWIDGSERRCLRAAHTLIDASDGLHGITRALAHSRIEDTGGAASVQILTIHRSKGLEFDLVLLPDIDARSGGAAAKEFWTRGEGGRVEGILESVNRPTRAAFPALEEWAVGIERERDMENLCVHYVAMTRAREELYLFLSEAKGKSKTGIHRWIERAFQPEDKEGAVVVLGDGPAPPEPPEREPTRDEEPPPPPAVPAGAPPHRRLLTPSGGTTRAGPSPFHPGARRSLSLGLRVHAALAALEWPGTEWTPDRADPEVASVLGPALADPAVRALLSPAEPGATVWRERAFDAALGGTWTSGVFDRVHLPRGWRTASDPVMLLDFKTDRSPAAEPPAAHREQMRAYRGSLALLLGIGEERIRSLLIYLREPRIVEVD